LTANDEVVGLEQKPRYLARSFENMNNRLLNFFSRAVFEQRRARSASMHL